MAEEIQQNESSLASDVVPLCVDLDKTLVRTDTLVESVSILMKRKPWLLVMLPFWLMSGRHKLKANLAKHVDLDPAQLPYNSEVFFYLKRMSKRGRKLILVTGAHESVAKRVFDYLQVFDEYIASDASVNNVGAVKAQKLVELFGERGFDYIGDTYSDLRVWEKARSGSIVSSRKGLVQKARNTVYIEKVFRTKSNLIKSIIKAIRVHQWAKNLLIFAPMALGLSSTFKDQLIACIWGFVSFSLLASSIYLINDIFDLEADREHEDKKHRPFASGDLSVSFAIIAVPLLVLGSLGAAYMTQVTGFWFVLGVYVVITNLYTFHIKSVPVLDIIVLTSLYSLRLWAGRELADAPLSEWLLAFSGFFFLSLAMIKRMSELIQMRNSGKTTAKGRGYHVDDIVMMLGLGGAAGYGAVVVMSLYINSQQAKLQYENPQVLWLIPPILIYWFTRIWFLANRGEVDSDPVKFALTDSVSLGIGLGMGIIWYSAKVGLVL